LVAIFYPAPNSSTWQSLPHQEVLNLLSDLSFPECCPISQSRKLPDHSFSQLFSLPRTFPWFDQIAAQLRESLSSQLLEKSQLVWCHLALLYQASFGHWPAKQCGLISTKTSLTSAIVEPDVTLDNKSPFSTAASNIFSEIPDEPADYDSKSS
ncbi:NXRD1 protein, partial [Aegotheles bennettii]|nr:NXRD1 protein [Aegotheles bennettii]